MLKKILNPREKYLPYYELNLYDSCIAIDAANGKPEEVNQILGISERSVLRRVQTLQKIGIKIEVHYKWDKKLNRLKVTSYDLNEPIHSALEKLDITFGLYPHPRKSKLSENEQDRILETYSGVLNGKNGRWPKNYFKTNRKEKIRVILPFCLENILGIDLEDISRKSIREAGLSEIVDRYFNRSPKQLLRVIYPWLS